MSGADLERNPMLYMILIYGDERNFATLAHDPEAQKQMYAPYTRYGASMREAMTIASFKSRASIR